MSADTSTPSEPTVAPVEPTETETPETPAAPASPAEAPEAPETTPAEDPAPEGDPAPEASVAQPKLSAFERGKMRALGMGGLITRLENSEGQLSAALGKIKTLEAENARLKAGSAAEQQAAQAKIEAAQKGRENEVSQGVRAKLSALGVPETEAPAASGEEDKKKQLTRAEFEKLDHASRNAFMREGGKIISE